MSTWLINGQSPEDLGLTVVGGQFNSGRASSVRLQAVIDFDAAEVFAYNADVEILRDGSPFFNGKVREIPKYGDDSSEAQEYLVEDAWAELERLIYQEPWGMREGAYSGAVYSPTVVLGVSSAGTRISVGQQIEEVLNFAVAQGVDIIVGDVPAGMTLWPSEVTGMSCAQIIRDVLKYYPDWIPWIDHSTTPNPTFNVTQRADATAITMPVTSTSDLSVTKVQDRIPAGVRIVYLTADLVLGQVYRRIAIDQFPTVSTAVLRAAAGPGILVTTVELAGMQVQIQKQQVQVRELPITKDTAKEYLKVKFPVIKDVPLDKFGITAWTTAVIPETEDEADPVDDKLERIPGGIRSDLPNELIKGAVAEWMQKKVGRVLIEMKVIPAPSATADQVKRIAALPKQFEVIATDAITKTYAGVSSYTTADDRPVGIAQAYYQTILAACLFSGQFRVQDDELPDVGAWHGSKVNLSGSANGEWATMGAPIHSVSWDLRTCSATVGFGPNPEYSVQDFIEFLKLLNKRPHNDYTFAERSGDKLGDDGGISARGDSIGAYDVPGTIIYPNDTTQPPPFSLKNYTIEGGAIKVQINIGWIREIITLGDTNGSVFHAPESAPGITLASTPTPEFTMAAGNFLFVTYHTDNQGGIKSDPKPAFLITSTDEPTQHYQPPNPDDDGLDGIYAIKIGKLISATEEVIVWTQFQNSDIEHYHELWTGENVGAGARVFLKRNPETDTYQFRSINGTYGITETEEGEQIDLNFAGENVGGGEEVLVVDPENPLPDGPAQFRTLRALSSDEATAEGITPQIQVEAAAGTGDVPTPTIRIRGNGVNGSLTSNSETLVAWEDGLVTSGDVDFEASEIPDGDHTGDLLMWGGAAWGLLHPPTGTSDDTYELGCTGGGVPAWKLVDTRTVSICVDGSPSTIEVYIDP